MAKSVIYFGLLAAFCPGVWSMTYYYMNSLCRGTLRVSINEQVRLKYSFLSYSDNTRCKLHIQNDNGDRFLVHFESMDIEYKPDCGYDFLSIYDGSSEYSSSLTYDNRLCGGVTPNDERSSGPYLTFYFQSDGHTTGAGFDVILTPFHTGHCTSGEYDCDNGYCIGNSLSCTNHNPCGDYSDCNIHAKTGMIVGLAVGSLTVVIIIIVVIIVCRRRRSVITRNPVLGVATIQLPLKTTTTTYAPPPSYAQVAQFGSQQTLQQNYSQPPPYPAAVAAVERPSGMPFPPATRLAFSSQGTAPDSRAMNSTELQAEATQCQKSY